MTNGPKKQMKSCGANCGANFKATFELLLESGFFLVARSRIELETS
jgi:hypothetical protein